MNALLLATALAAGAPDTARAAADTREILRELIAVDTTNPPGKETAAARKVAERLRRAGLAAEVVESEPGRGSLIARLKGDGSKRPLLLIAHLDVVGANAKEWTAPPFKLTEKDGFLYGRGVSDDKGMAAAITAIVLDLKRRATPLARDVILALTADEEDSGHKGIVWILKNKKAQVAAELCLNEGGGARLDGDKLQYVGLQTAEKTYQTFALRTTAEGGHSSVPLPNNAIVRLANALTRVGLLRLAPRLNETTRAYFAARAELESGEIARAMRAAATATGDGPPSEAEAVLGADPLIDAQLRTTCVATTLKAGIRENALPTEAAATVNCRIVPGETPEGMREILKDAIADEGVAIEPDNDVGGPTVPVEGPVMDAAREVSAAIAGGARVIPVMSTGATDSRYLRAAGIACYGLKPFPMVDADARRAHGPDERMSVKSLAFGVEFLYRVVEKLAGK